MSVQPRCSPGELSRWQRVDTRALAVLEEVFRWLEGEELARAGATCRLWRQVAATPVLWRRLVLRGESDLRASWRDQYVRAHAAWVRTERTDLGALVLHGALSTAGDRLAVATADASVSVWEPEYSTWLEVWRCGLRESRGWTSAARVEWAPSGGRLLCAGPLALAELATAWEILILQFDEKGTGRIASHARCGAGAAGCWANVAGDAFLSLEPVLLAPGLAVTSVWLNAATQETQSEYAGVASRLFRIYNEGGKHLSHVVVAEPRSDAEAERCDSTHHESVMVAAWGKMLGSWSFGRSRPEPVEVQSGGLLTDRVRVMRERALLPDPEPAEIDEVAVRSQCVPPLATCELCTAPIGLVFVNRPDGPRLWIVTSDGAVTGFSTPDLVPLRVLTQPSAFTPLSLHYVQPAVSEYHVASPQGSLSGDVCVWPLRGAGAGRARLLGHGAPTAAALLVASSPATMLVLAGEELHTLPSTSYGPLANLRRGLLELGATLSSSAHCLPRHDADTHAGMAPRLLLSRLGQEARPLAAKLVRLMTSSCSGPKPDPPCECRSPAGPRCRTEPPRPAPVLRVLCRPAPPTRPPPCAPCEPSTPLTCNDTLIKKSFQEVPLKPSSPSDVMSCELEHPEGGRDRVACRLASAERARRLHYEQEAGARPPARPRTAPPAHYRLGGSVPAATPATLTHDAGCRIRRGAHADPCAHRPRLQLEIRRAAADPPHAASIQRSAAQPRVSNAATRGRCEITIPPAAGPPRCTPPSIVERLRSLSRTAGTNRLGDRRGLQTTPNGVSAPAEADTRHEDRLREEGRAPLAPRAAGTLELDVPAGARTVRVRVQLEDDPTGHERSTLNSNKDPWLSIQNIQNKLSAKKKETYPPGEQMKRPWSSPCAGRVGDADGAAGARRGGSGVSALVSATPVPSQ